jgi:hypothetical protein
MRDLVQHPGVRGADRDDGTGNLLALPNYTARFETTRGACEPLRTFGLRTWAGGVLLLVGLAWATTGCVSTTRLSGVQATNRVLATGGKFAENTWIACITNYYAQGIPLTQARDLCAVKLGDLAKKGFGFDSAGPVQVGKNDMFDPAKVTAACASADSRIGQGRSKETNSANPELKKASDIKGFEGTTLIGGGEGYGYWTYGGKGKIDPEDGKAYRGLSKEQSEGQKKEAMEKADALLKEKQKLEGAVRAEKDPQKKAQLQDQLKKKAEEWSAAHKKAYEDPNKREPGTSHPAGNEATACDEALQAARETLYECNRTGWKSAGCKSLEAKLHGCPQPELIYVDPDAGYACDPKVDPEALKDAWVAHCEELRRGVDGQNPCVKPDVDESGRLIAGQHVRSDLCNDPAALVDPEQNSCIAALVVPRPFGEPSVHQLVVFGLNKFGGPVVVLTRKDPEPPKPGPEPRPNPNP